MSQTLEAVLSVFDPNIPVERASTPPGSWYQRDDVFELEMSTVFNRRWVCICVSSAVPKIGDFLTVDLGPEPVLVVRGEDGKLRAFYNVCQHHAACLVANSGRTTAFVCPYHGWTYTLDGRLMGTPNMGPVKDFDRKSHSLKSLFICEWMGFVFVSQSTPSTPALSQSLSGLKERLDSHGGRLQHHIQTHYDLDCNWKVFADNYLDGGYHVSRVHPDLADSLSLRTYNTETFGGYSIQSCAAKGGERLGAGALYAYVHPNLMINRYGPVLDTNVLLPLGPRRCRVVFDYFFDEDASLSLAEKKAFVQASHRVQLEDMGICRKVQKGLGSRGYSTGRYAPILEKAMHAFHCDLARMLQSGLIPD